eukprot:gene10225-biopygen3277
MIELEQTREGGWGRTARRSRHPARGAQCQSQAAPQGTQRKVLCSGRGRGPAAPRQVCDVRMGKSVRAGRHAGGRQAGRRAAGMRAAEASRAVFRRNVRAIRLVADGWMVGGPRRRSYSKGYHVLGGRTIRRVRAKLEHLPFPRNRWSQKISFRTRRETPPPPPPPPPIRCGGVLGSHLHEYPQKMLRPRHPTALPPIPAPRLNPPHPLQIVTTCSIPTATPHASRPVAARKYCNRPRSNEFVLPTT